MKTNLVNPAYQENLNFQNSWTANNTCNDFLENLYKIIEDNFDTPFLTVGFLATNLAISKSTLNRKLSSIIGLSANELIRQYRLKRAAIFLRSGKNVSETAYLSGFETPSYFTQCFKEFYKVTPKEYSKCTLFAIF
ncbi:MAG TPA: AraC family transcriptional regulator [Chitinophagaceae bacterium]|jgi:AraC-like DNA-binding protein